jgi:hypothetical protein
MTGTSTRAICSLKSFLDITLFGVGCVNGSRVPLVVGTTQSACVFLFPIREATEVLIITYRFLLSVSFRVIEENTLKSCPDLIVECIAVGNGRPSPVLLIELNPGAATLGDGDSIKREVYRRIRHFQSRRLAHERIKSVESLVIVQRTAWPRTPAGHIRRTDAEQKFQRELDRAYAAASAR